MDNALKSDNRYRIDKMKLRFVPYEYKIPYYFLQGYAKGMGFVRSLDETEAEMYREEILRFMGIKKGSWDTCYDAWWDEVFKMNGLTYSHMKFYINGSEDAQKANGLIHIVKLSQPIWMFACFLAPVSHTQMFSTNAEENTGKSRIYTGS